MENHKKVGMKTPAIYQNVSTDLNYCFWALWTKG